MAVLALAAVFVFAPGAGRGVLQDQKREQPVQDMDMGGAEGMEGMEEMDVGGMNMPADGTIRITADEIGTFGITFGTVDVRPLTKTIRTVGLIEFDEAKMTSVSPKFGGWVEKLYIDFTGQPVARGQPLLDVYSPELVTAQEELLLAARLADSVESSPVEGVTSGAHSLRESAMRRLRYWDISEPQIRQVLETGQVRRTLTLYAPVSGIVMEKDVFEGQAFQPGADLYRIAGLDEVWVNAEIFEADAVLVHEGMPAEITVDALPGQSFASRVEYVYPTLEEQTRSMRARISMPNPGGRLKPGMFATVKFGADLGEALTVPASAVLYSGERAVAFVDMGRGEITPHELTVGVRAGDYVQVLEGLEPGQRVVTSAQYLLDSESNLAAVMKAMMAQMNLSDLGSMNMGGMESMDTERKD